MNGVVKASTYADIPKHQCLGLDFADGGGQFSPIIPPCYRSLSRGLPFSQEYKFEGHFSLKWDRVEAWKHIPLMEIPSMSQICW